MPSAKQRSFAKLEEQRTVPLRSPLEVTGILGWTQSEDSMMLAIDKQHLWEVSVPRSRSLRKGGVAINLVNSLDSEQSQRMLWPSDEKVFEDIQRVAILRQPAGPRFTGSKRFGLFGGPQWHPDKDKSWSEEIEIPILHLHCPKKEGCKTSYEVSKTTKRGSGMTLKALDSGFESETELSYTFTSSVDTQDGDCIWLLQTVLVAFVPGTITDDDLYIAGIRIGVEKAIGQPVHRSIPKAKDLCMQSFRKLKTAINSGEAVEFDRSGVKGKGGTLTESAEVAGEWTAKLSLGLTIGLAKDVDLSAGLSMSRSIAESLKYSYTLVGGSKYVRYPQRFADPLSTSGEPCWTTA